MNSDHAPLFEIRIELVGGGLRLQVPETTALALGDPPAIRFFRDDQGQLRLTPTMPEILGAIPIKPMAFEVARGNPVMPPPLPPGRYLLADPGDGTLVFVGMEGGGPESEPPGKMGDWRDLGKNTKAGSGEQRGSGAEAGDERLAGGRKTGERGEEDRRDSDPHDDGSADDWDDDQRRDVPDDDPEGIYWDD